jgi:hypothetical protein
MATETTTLTEFLLARIAEDEGTAIYAQTRYDLEPEDWGGWWFGHQQHYSRYDPARVIAECEAKRRIVERHANSGASGCYICAEAEREQVECVEQRILAAVYADHPDYREEWRTCDHRR